MLKRRMFSGLFLLLQICMVSVDLAADAHMFNVFAAFALEFQMFVVFLFSLGWVHAFPLSACQ